MNKISTFATQTFTNSIQMITIIDVFSFLGAFAFAISGIRLASKKQFDWFGAYIVGLVTAIGGGTLRDLLLDQPPFWMEQGWYLISTLMALLFVVALGKYVNKLSSSFFVFDTIGLAVFTIAGIEKTLVFGYSYWIAIVMGVMTGCLGGIIRDIFINETPLIFRKEIYAIASIIGGILYLVSLHVFNLSKLISYVIGFSSIVLVRFLAVKYEISLPQLRDSQ